MSRCIRLAFSAKNLLGNGVGFVFFVGAVVMIDHLVWVVALLGFLDRFGHGRPVPLPLHTYVAENTASGLNSTCVLLPVAPSCEVYGIVHSSLWCRIQSFRHSLTRRDDVKHVVSDQMEWSIFDFIYFFAILHSNTCNEASQEDYPTVPQHVPDDARGAITSPNTWLLAFPFFTTERHIP